MAMFNFEEYRGRASKTAPGPRRTCRIAYSDQFQQGAYRWILKIRQVAEHRIDIKAFIEVKGII
jgi:hypothetical protein